MMTDNKFAPLFERTYINKLGISNRLVMAPMGAGLDFAAGTVGDKGIDYYEARAKGGAGMLIIGFQLVTNKTDPAWSRMYGLDTEMQTMAWARLCDRVKSYGTSVCVQLSCGLGRNSRPVPGVPNVAASGGIPSFWDPSQVTRELSAEEIQGVVGAFGRAARRAKMAGVDAIEIHGHLGYLLDSFMTPLWNKRTDEYGGSFENRMRFPTEIYQAVRDAVGPDYPVLFRLCIGHKIPGGRTEEESLEIVKYLDQLGIDAFDVDAGCYDAYDWAFPTPYMGDAPMAYIGEMVKKVTDKPVLNAGSYTPEAALKAVEEGKTDFVVIGRGMLAEPEYGRKLWENRREDIRPCMRCNEYCLTKTMRGVSCALNQAAGAEKEYEILPAKHKRRVAVIGAGPGGLEAARVAAEKGHQVTVYEKAAEAGGQLIAASAPGFKSQLRALLDYYKTQMGKLGVTMVMNHEISADSPELAEADRIIIATGAHGFIPSIPGARNANVLEVIDAHTGDQSRIGQKVVVAGGGFSGCDCAIELAQEGKEVTVVEMMDKLVPKANIAAAISVNRTIREQGVQVYTGTKVLEFSEKGVKVETPDGAKELEADTIIAAFGTRPNSQAAKEIFDRYPNSVQVGDCVEIGQIGEAVRAGFLAGWGIE